MQFIVNRDRDAYAEATGAQNTGFDCPHCGSISGHKAHCALINIEAAQELKHLEALYALKQSQEKGEYVLG